jgi:hypothetical protein
MLNIANSSVRRKLLPSTIRLPGPRWILLRPFFSLVGLAMGLFSELFGEPAAFVYHCFDRIVTHGYLTGLSRPDQVAHFFRQVVGARVTTKEILKASSPVRRRDLAATT